MYVAYPLTGRLRGLLAPILERPLSTSTPLVNLPFQSNHATAADKVPKRGTVATQSHNHKPQGNNGQNTDDCHKTTKPSVRETEVTVIVYGNTYGVHITLPYCRKN